MPSTSHSSIHLCLSCLCLPLTFFPQGYQCPCPWLYQLVGVGLAFPLCKKPPQLPLALGIEVGIGGKGVGKPLATAPNCIWLGRSNCADPSSAKAPEGPAYRYDRCRNPRGVGGPSSPISDFEGASGAADVAPARWTAPGVNLLEYPESLR